MRKVIVSILLACSLLITAAAPAFALDEGSISAPSAILMEARTGKILAATPMGRFGESAELDGALLFLINNDAAGFITGVVLPVDGGFSSYSGV